MAKETTIIPLAQLNVASKLAQLRALQSQAQAYAMVGAFVVPGIPDIPAMIRELLRRLYEEIIRRLLAYVNMLIAMAKSKAAEAVIPLINDILRLVNKIINNINSVIDTLFPACKAIFYIIIAVTTIYTVSKVVALIPSVGAGMGAVVVFDTFKTVLNDIMNMSSGWLQKLWPIGFAIIAVMMMLIKYYSYIQMVYAMLKQFIMSNMMMFNSANSDFNKTADDWSNSSVVGSTEINQNSAGDDIDNLVECTLPDGSITNITPQECTEAGGTFPGMELLKQLIEIEKQINNLNKELEMLGGDEIVNCLLPDGTIEEMTFNDCLAAGGKALTQDELDKLLSERDNLLFELGKKAKINLSEDVVTSLLYPNDDVTIQDITDKKGKRYGFYESYRRVKK